MIEYIFDEEGGRALAAISSGRGPCFEEMQIIFDINV
jgi:hypothetical protein